MIAAWVKLPANLRGACFIAVGGFLLIVMVAVVKHLGQSLPAFQILFVRFLAGLIVIAPVVWSMVRTRAVPACAGVPPSFLNTVIALVADRRFTLT